MSAFERLEEAISHLNQSISEFPVGAVSVDDFKPIEEKIKDMRVSLRRLNARLLTLKAQKESETIEDVPEKNEQDTLKKLHEATANALINERAMKLCLHSDTIQAILNGKEGDTEMRKNIYASMRKLLTLNDSTLSVQQAIENASQKQLDLKIQCRNALFEYKHFLKEQGELRSKILQETNPELARNKEKTKKTLEKINIMKRLITSFIATSGDMLMEEPILVEMLERHRELINIETILKMSQDGTENEL